MGDPAKGRTPFWKTRGWYLVLRNAIWWAGKQDEMFRE
jgi:hypothetical protein